MWDLSHWRKILKLLGRCSMSRWRSTLKKKWCDNLEFGQSLNIWKFQEPKGSLSVTANHAESTRWSQLRTMHRDFFFFFWRKTMHRDIILALSSFLARGFFISTTYIYVYSYVSCIFIFIVKCRLSNKKFISYAICMTYLCL